MANVYWHLMIASFCNSFHLFIHHWKWFQKFPFLVEYFAYDNLQYTLCVWMLTKQWFWLSIFESRQCCCCLKITQEKIWHLKNKILETIWFFFSWQLCQRKLLHNLIRNKQEKIRAWKVTLLCGGIGSISCDYWCDNQDDNTFLWRFRRNARRLNEFFQLNK